MPTMATEDEDDVSFKGPALRPDGQITGRTPAASPPPELDARFGAMELQRAPSLELELAERPPKKVEPRVESFRDEPPPPRRRLGLKVALGAVALGIALFSTFLFAPRSFLARVGLDARRDAFELGPLSFRSPAPPLILESTPSGATITISGKVVGTTPWAGDNTWPDQAPISVSLRGYSLWQGQLIEGRELKANIKLKPAGRVDVKLDVGDLDHGEQAP
jgi:serine/threonine-protein kinase